MKARGAVEALPTVAPPRAAWMGDKAVGLLMIAPTVLTLGGLVGYPLLYNFYVSLYDKHAFLPAGAFVGLTNYLEILGEREFWLALQNATVYTVATVALQLGAGVGSALLLNQRFPGRNLLRGAVLFPYLVPTIVVVILWKWILHESYGIVNHLLVMGRVVDQPVVWLGERHIMLALILVSVWQFFPFVTVSALARMQSIPPELYEAARVDGASAIGRFRHVTLPQLREVLLVVLLLRAIFMFTKFDTVYLMAGAEAVGRDVATLPVLVFIRTFEVLRAGSGAAIAVVILLIQLAASIAYLRLVREDAKA